eukprot:m.212557 g.212557  ORF g.212557 m.212557 type:complete len:54 (+) comp39775_c0_seq18:964-1125(+)
MAESFQTGTIGSPKSCKKPFCIEMSSTLWCLNFPGFLFHSNSVSKYSNMYVLY